jgi:DNA-directed RNA polymerase subunit RPC12/RpoP
MAEDDEFKIALAIDELEGQCKHKCTAWRKTEKAWVCLNCNQIFQDRKETLPENSAHLQCKLCGSLRMADALESRWGLVCIGCFAKKLNGG